MKISKHLSKIVAIVGAMVGVAGIVIAYLTLVKGSADRIEEQYKTHLQEIGRFHNDKNLSAGTLLMSLSDVINKKADQGSDENRRLRSVVASALIIEFRAGDFDFKQSRNLELDRVALSSWQEYKRLLVKDPNSNINILLNYKHAISNLRKEDPPFVEAALPLDGGGMYFGVSPKDNSNDTLLRNLHNCYREHVALLKESLGINNDQTNRDNLLKAFCWYSDATHNPNMTKDAFGYNSTAFETETRRCSQQHR